MPDFWQVKGDAPVWYQIGVGIPGHSRASQATALQFPLAVSGALWSGPDLGPWPRSKLPRGSDATFILFAQRELMCKVPGTCHQKAGRIRQCEGWYYTPDFNDFSSSLCFFNETTGNKVIEAIKCHKDINLLAVFLMNGQAGEDEVNSRGRWIGLGLHVWSGQRITCNQGPMEVCGLVRWFWPVGRELSEQASCQNPLI